MGDSAGLLESVLQQIRQLDGSLKSQTLDYSPVLLKQPPSTRASRQAELSQALEHLELQWSLLEEITTHVENARNVLRHQRSLCHSALAPVSALPQEVLGHIFHYALPIDGISQYERSAKRIRNLSQVCRDWHVVGLQQKRAWGFGNISSLSDIAKMDLLLDRSESQGLTLTVRDRQETQLATRAAKKLRDRVTDLDWRCRAPLETLFDFLRWPHTHHSPPVVFSSLQTLRISSLHEQPLMSVNLNGMAFPLLSSTYM